MLRFARYLVLALGMSAALTVPLAQPASAAAGDYASTGCGRVDGQPYGMACDTYMKTNKCTGGVASFRLQWVDYAHTDPQDDRVVVSHQGTGGCGAKIRHRVKYGSQSPQWLTAVTISPNSAGWFGQTPRNRELCWTDFSVQRSDGTWLKHRHYSAKWGANATWRAACRTDA